MPHISELQEHYVEAVRFIGVTREERGVVDEFLAQEQREGATWADVITYRLAIDEADATNNAYMRAAGQNGIPCAFIVGKDGVVEWIGHPMEIDAPLEAIVNDRYDREAAVAEMAAKQRLNEMSRTLMTLQREQKWDEAIALFDTMQNDLKEIGIPVNTLRMMTTRLDLLVGAGRLDEARELRSTVVEMAWENPMLLNMVAWNTATSDTSTDADLEQALKGATRAAELTEHADASILDTLARVHYELGDLDQAITWQEKAVALSEGNASVEQTLKQYQAEQAGGGNATPAAELDSGAVEIEIRD